MKQKVYIETSILSYLTARPSNDIRAMANQNTTIEWWENRMPEFDIFISEFIDAYHIAVAAVNGMDYLLTWNCKHIANAVMRPMVEQVCRNHGFEPPTICTPQELMEGQ
jgi:hypothetical protein